MNLSKPFIDRPVATTLLCAGLVIAGLTALRLLPVAPLPSVNVPTIKVSAALPGAGPQTMATAVAAPLERALSRISGITMMTSTSVAGATSIRLVFNLDRDMNAAARDVQAALNAAQSRLPDLPANPTYRAVTSGDAPVMVLALTSKRMTPAQMYAAASTTFTQMLSQVAGVSQVDLVGGSLPAVRVKLFPPALSRYDVGFAAVRRAIAAADPTRPVGALDSGGRHWQIATNDQLQSLAAFKSVVVAARNGVTVHLDDVARVVHSVRNTETAGLANGEPAVLAIVRRKPQANILDVTGRITQELPALRASLPSGMGVTVVTSRANTVRASFRDAAHALGLAVILVVLVMLAFLRDIRSAVIASVSAPISIIGALAVMYWLGLSLNNFTLMALTITVGFAVDDAVVVVENISRHVENGMPPRQAARVGAGEIGLTVLSMSLVLVAAFIPLLLLQGYVGLFVRGFAVTIAIVVFISLVVSLTLVPMLCAYWLKPASTRAGRRRLYRWSGRALARLLRVYDRSLSWALRHAFLTVAVLVGVIALNLFLYVAIPKGFFPRQDTGQLTGALSVGGSGSFRLARQKLGRFVNVVGADPAVADVAGFVRGNSGSLFATLEPLSRRSATADQVAARIRARLADIPGAMFGLKSVQNINMGGHRSRSAYAYTIQANSSGALREWVPRVRKALAALPELRDVRALGTRTRLATFVHINRDTAARLGVSVSQIDTALHNAFAQPLVSTISGPARRYPVIMGVAPAYARSPQAFDHIEVNNTRALGVPLSVMASYSQFGVPLSVHHLGQTAASTIAFNLAPGVALSQATGAIRHAVDNLSVPSSVRGSFQGAAKAFQQVLGQEPVLIAVALLTLFIVLGVLYESFIHPLTILSTLPSAGIGALLALLAFDTVFSVIVFIGILALIGIVMKNAIMMVDFALDSQRRLGLDAREAIHRACLLRFRPILMTSLAVLLASIPLALLHGNGAEMRQPLGIAIGGGIVVSQLLTLYTTPAVYLYAERFSGWANGRMRRLGAWYKNGRLSPRDSSQ